MKPKRPLPGSAWKESELLLVLLMSLLTLVKVRRSSRGRWDGDMAASDGSVDSSNSVRFSVGAWWYRQVWVILAGWLFFERGKQGQVEINRGSRLFGGTLKGW